MPTWHDCGEREQIALQDRRGWESYWATVAERRQRAMASAFTWLVWLVGIGVVLAVATGIVPLE